MRIPHCISKLSGHLYLHKYPGWVIYRPDVHRIKGYHVRQVLGVVAPGDILLRRYDGYLNTICTPGYWGHAGLYVGDNQVVHAVEAGVVIEDILDFCRTDAICVLIPNCDHKIAVDIALNLAAKKIGYDYDFDYGNEKYYCTELIDKCCQWIFLEDRIEKLGNLILIPDGIRSSKMATMKLEIKPQKNKRRIKMVELTPNTNVSGTEATVFSVTDTVYPLFIRDLVINAVDDPEHMYDDRVLAMLDGLFNFQDA